MPSETPVVLELDDIQSGRCMTGLRRMSASTSCFASTTTSGREFLRGVIPALAPAANPADPIVRLGSPPRSPFRA